VEKPMTAPKVDANGVIERLSGARVAGPSGLAFDADGTLWAGDVGEDVFEFACAEKLLTDAPLAELVRVARAHGVSDAGTSSDVAQSLYQGYRRGVVNELSMCEIMTWSYAGLTNEELRSIAQAALTRRGLVDRARRVLAPVFDFARREALRVVVISASPKVIVTEALRIAEIRVDDLAAARPALNADLISPALDGKVPYGPEKPVAGKRLLAGHDWLGSFGDNGFDVEMLIAARIGVAVHPKPALIARLGELSNVVVVE
jgi:phosphatidylglycerophosphatase C